jgi:nucleotide-binding universal stress UspA family protein
MAVNKPKILYASGGSEESYNAIEGTARLAKGLDASITLLTVDDPKRKIDIRQVQERVDQILSKYGLKCDKRVRRGNPAKEILEESKNFDYLIIGSHGLTGALEKLLGGDAEHIIENINTSTLVFRGNKISKILACINLPKYSEYVVSNAIKFAKATRSPLEFLYVVPEPFLYPIRSERASDELKSIYKDKATIADKLVERAFKEGLEACSVFREGVPEEEIVLEAQEKDFDLIVLGDSGIRGILAELTGSLSSHIVKNSPVSVLVVKK